MNKSFPSFRHNKKRNIGLISEFFSRYIAEAFVDQRHKDVRTARSIWEKHMHKDSEMLRELSMFSSLFEAKLKNKEIAFSMMDRVREACSLQEQAKLDAEKAALLNEINEKLLDEAFFKRPVEEYKTFASVQMLMNGWRGTGFKGTHSEFAQLEESVLEHILTPKKECPEDLENIAENLTNEEVDSLVIKLMTEKFNTKYENLLTDTQKNIVQLYAFAKDHPEKKKELIELLEDSKKKTLRNAGVTVLKEGLGSIVNTKLNEVADILKGEMGSLSVSEKLSEEKIVFYMSLAKLNEELESEK